MKKLIPLLFTVCLLAGCATWQSNGGKVLSSHTRKSTNRVAAHLRLAAVTLGRTDTALGAFYRRLSARVGKAKAVTATARKNKTKRYVDLQWSGAAGSSIVITRTGSSGKTLTSTNDGLYTDAVNVGTYSYKVCEAASGGACSPIVSVTVN